MRAIWLGWGGGWVGVACSAPLPSPAEHVEADKALL